MKDNPSPSTGNPLTYREAGVDLEAKAQAFQRIKGLVQSTYSPEVLSELGTFGGLFALQGFREPVLVSSVDSVGTKLKIAFALDRHDTVGYDIVAHCANDILVQGARPLFFLDYIGIGRLRPEVVEAILRGLVRGCQEVGCALIGGETAELPDLYAPGEYDLVGTIVGAVERERLITGAQIRPGDVLVGLPSVGLHTNGYTLARKILFERVGLSVRDEIPGLGISVGEELLKPHRSYVAPCLELMETVPVRGMAHITGGGLPENLARILPEGCRAVVDRSTWTPPPIFGYLQRAGEVPESEMFRVFNMGIGMVIVLARSDLEAAVALLHERGEAPILIGEVVSGPRAVEIRSSKGEDRNQWGKYNER
ncbi:MAG: phosphoribosylformylglycinamidine cyclo-ligase [Candidatus Poribacteria bacterium]|nr:MAG: phosphoribosylformylglycinamidine cyclo-ligase [Candidatus Poribacteria bacterium]